MTDTALAVRESTAIEQFGTADDLKLLANRIGILFGIGQGKQSAAYEAEMERARPALLKAAQWTLRYGYTPGQDIYIVPRGGGYSAEPSVEAWRKTADRHAWLGKFRWWVEVEPLTQSEVQERTDPDVRYTPEDKGARARIWRTDLTKEFGGAYKPRWHYAFWRKEAENKNGEWKPDRIPNGRGRQDVADRRAERAALMTAFSMIPLDDFESRYKTQAQALQQRLLLASNHIDMKLQEQAEVGHGEEEGTLSHDAPTFEMDGNGDVWAVEQPRKRKAQSSAPEVEEGQFKELPPEGSTVEKEGSVSEGEESQSGGGDAPSQEGKRAPSPATSPTPATVPDGTPVWKTWTSPVDAQAWAFEVAGTVATRGEAIGSWKKVAKRVYPDKDMFGAEEWPAIFEAFHEHQWAKLRERSKLENVPEMAA